MSSNSPTRDELQVISQRSKDSGCSMYVIPCWLLCAEGSAISSAGLVGACMSVKISPGAAERKSQKPQAIEVSGFTEWICNSRQGLDW